ncbi:major facilitator superfamily MFS_1 [Eggerthella sp. CAG:1427]|nr:major facilitator superfamily MFS_1 [Eggerthella sp. CAG:1427]
MFTSYAASFAAIWYVTESTGSALALSFLSICAYLPQGLLSPFGGVLADRLNRKYLIILADSICGLASFALGLIILFGQVSFAAIVVMVIIRSAAQAFHYPALMALMPMLVPEKHLLRINTLDQLLLSVSGMAAPVLGIFFYTVVGFHSVMFLDFAGALIACAGMLLAKVPSTKCASLSSNTQSSDNTPNDSTSDKHHVLADLKEGWVALKRVRGLFVLIILITLGMVCFSPMSSLYPLMTFDYFQGDGYMASIAEATFAAGLLIGSSILMVWGGGKKLTRLIAIACISFGLLCSVSGLISPNMFWIFAILCAGMGLVSAWFNGPMMTLIQRNTAEETMGRVIGLVNTGIALAGPVGIAAGGIFAEFMGVAPFFVVDGILCAFIGILITAFKSVRKLDTNSSNQDPA